MAHFSETHIYKISDLNLYINCLLPVKTQEEDFDKLGHPLLQIQNISQPFSLPGKYMQIDLSL